MIEPPTNQRGNQMQGFVTMEEVDSVNPSSVGIRASITATLIECWCLSQLQWVTHETDNVPALWERVIRHVRAYLLGLWASWMLTGKSAEEAFVVKCDHTTMTPADIRDGYLICLVGVAPVKPLEFVHYRIRIRLKSRQSPSSQVDNPASTYSRWRL